MNQKINDLITEITAILSNMDVEEKIGTLNNIKLILHENSPMKNEPVDCVLWVKAETVHANDYNPNKVAPPEMELLKVSILSDGYTQPIVTFTEAESHTVVDGFHRNRVGREVTEIYERVKGYLPITIIRPSQEDKGDRIAATIRHNRARGKHTVDGMSNIVLELKKRNWSGQKISRELGMNLDEVLRLAQITGLAEAFKDREFSRAWEKQEIVQ
jgi:ParB-like chromosome segregation protein Spo0J